MDGIIEAVNGVSVVWLGLMWAVAWQAALLVGTVALLAGALRRSSPVVRYWLWQIVAIKLLLMPLWTAAIPLPSWAGGRPAPRVAAERPPEHVPSIPDDANPPDVDDLANNRSGEETPAEVASIAPAVSPVSAAPVAPQSAPAAGSWQSLGEVSWQSWLLVAWSGVVVLHVVRLVLQRIRLGRLLQQAAPAQGPLATLVAESADQLNLRRRPVVLLIEADCPVFVCGLWRPTLVFPHSLADALRPDELRQVTLHELAHLKRHDLLLGWTAEIARMLYFFHPAVYWVCRRLRLERELACDQVAMAASGGTAAQYAQTLLRAVDHGATPPVLRTAEGMTSGLDGGVPSPEKNAQEDET